MFIFVVATFNILFIDKSNFYKGWGQMYTFPYFQYKQKYTKLSPHFIRHSCIHFPIFVRSFHFPVHELAFHLSPGRLRTVCFVGKELNNEWNKWNYLGGAVSLATNMHVLIGVVEESCNVPNLSKLQEKLFYDFFTSEM